MERTAPGVALGMGWIVCVLRVIGSVARGRRHRAMRRRCQETEVSLGPSGEGRMTERGKRRHAMVTLTADAALQAVLGKLNEPAEIRDAGGKVIG